MILSPKYWVMWDNRTGDINPNTLSKSLSGSHRKAFEEYGEDWTIDMEEASIIEFILIEINKVVL